MEVSTGRHICGLSVLSVKQCYLFATITPIAVSHALFVFQHLLVGVSFGLCQNGEKPIANMLSAPVMSRTST